MGINTTAPHTDYGVKWQIPVKGYQDKDIIRYFRGDAAFADPDIKRRH